MNLNLPLMLRYVCVCGVCVCVCFTSCVHYVIDIFHSRRFELKIRLSRSLRQTFLFDVSFPDVCVVCGLGHDYRRVESVCLKWFVTVPVPGRLPFKCGQGSHLCCLLSLCHTPNLGFAILPPDGCRKPRLRLCVSACVYTGLRLSIC